MVATRVTQTNAVSWEVFAAHFETAAAALQDLREATRVPSRYYFYYPTNFANLPTNPFLLLRVAAHWLTGDAIAALRARQLDRVAADLHALNNSRSSIARTSNSPASLLALRLPARGWQRLGRPCKRRVGARRTWSRCNRIGKRWIWGRRLKRASRANALSG